MGEAAAQTRYQVRLEAVRDRLAPEKIANAYRVLVPSARMFPADLIPQSLETFLGRLKQSARNLSVADKQKIIRLLVKEIIVEKDTIIARHASQ